jgi:hypothetical protein
MNFITGKQLPRRTFLRGMGASVALPLLDAMVPAGRAWRDASKEEFTRLVCLEEVHGAAGSNVDWGESRHLFAPAQVGRNFEFGADSQIKPLEEYRKYLTIVSNTDSRMAEPFNAQEIGGDHDRTAAVFLSQSHPRQSRSNIFLGKTLDQIHAERYGQDTILPSLELTTERVDSGGGCAYNYSCSYKTTLAWKSATEPLPAIREPRSVFEQLFGAGDSPADRTERLRMNGSLLDWMVGSLNDLKRELGAVDRLALDQYTTHIRELERRIQLVEAQNSSGEERRLPEAPVGVPDRWEEHMEIMFDLQLLALQGDITRVITFKTGTDLSNLSMPESGTNKSFHALSHHGNDPDVVMEFNMVNRHRLSQMAYFLEKMKSTMEGDASLLDKTAIIWGSSMGDPNLHNHRKCPLILMGHANGALEGNLHLRAPDGTPMANAFLSLMHGIGHDYMPSFGDSSGTFPLTAPRGVTRTAGEGRS